MKASKYSEGQIAFILKQAEDDVPVADVYYKTEIVETIFFN